MKRKRTAAKLGFISFTAGIIFSFITDCKAQYFTDSSGLESGLAYQVLGSAKQYKDRNIYPVLTSSIIDAIPDEELTQVITDNVRSKMNAGLSNEYEVVMKQCKPARLIYVLSQIEAEVNNGGFAQFYSSSAGKLADEATKAFDAIHASGFAELLKKANDLYKGQGVSAKLKGLDEEFFALYDKEDLKKLSIRYIRKNKKAFDEPVAEENFYTRKD